MIPLLMLCFLFGAMVLGIGANMAAAVLPETFNRQIVDIGVAIGGLALIVLATLPWSGAS